MPHYCHNVTFSGKEAIEVYLIPQSQGVCSHAFGCGGAVIMAGLGWILFSFLCSSPGCGITALLLFLTPRKWSMCWLSIGAPQWRLSLCSPDVRLRPDLSEELDLLKSVGCQHH